MSKSSLGGLRSPTMIVSSKIGTNEASKESSRDSGDQPINESGATESVEDWYLIKKKALDTENQVSKYIIRATVLDTKKSCFGAIHSRKSNRRILTTSGRTFCLKGPINKRYMQKHFPLLELSPFASGLPRNWKSLLEQSIENAKVLSPSAEMHDVTQIMTKISQKSGIDLKKTNAMKKIQKTAPVFCDDSEKRRYQLLKADAEHKGDLVQWMPKTETVIEMDHSLKTHLKSIDLNKFDAFIGGTVLEQTEVESESEEELLDWKQAHRYLKRTK